MSLEYWDYSRVRWVLAVAMAVFLRWNERVVGLASVMVVGTLLT